MILSLQRKVFVLCPRFHKRKICSVSQVPRRFIMGFLKISISNLFVYFLFVASVYYSTFSIYLFSFNYLHFTFIIFIYLVSYYIWTDSIHHFFFLGYSGCYNICFHTCSIVLLSIVFIHLFSSQAGLSDYHYVVKLAIIVLACKMCSLCSFVSYSLFYAPNICPQNG